MIKRCPQHGFFRGEHCECGSTGQLLLDETKTEQLGRLVAGGLRHFPGDLGLEMDSRGWVDLAKLGEVVRSRHRWASKELVIALVESDPKQRYEIHNDKVRARYGHSVDVELDHVDNKLPKLYYGASEEEADRILEIGLKSASQRYVHLSTTPQKAWHVASFRTGNPKIIQVDATNAQKEGVKMMTVNADIVISEMIPSRFLEILATKDILKAAQAPRSD
ncbi:MAG: putative RNA 2'-phosphotransferase [Methanosaeta sp. PtaB.Bin018]|nr:RNA 2'-phosphotransferase [Methanothrix sp.]OPX76082.1 MAG: putative RNA 2'-phosphotransferase [Methanosaeta sp. PtaB.Bin018]